MASLMPLAARLVRYPWANFWKELPAAPVVMVMVLGGAVKKNQKTARARAALTERMVVRAAPRLKPNMSMEGGSSPSGVSLLLSCGEGSRGGVGSLFMLCITMLLSLIPTKDI